MPTSALVTCPHCGQEFKIEEALARQLEEKLKQQFQREADALKADYRKRDEELLRKAREIDDEVARKLFAEKDRLAGEAAEQARLQYEDRLKALSRENDEQRKQVKDLRQAQIENEQLKRKVVDQRAELEVEFQKRMTATLSEEAEKIRRREAEGVELRLKEKDKQLEDIKAQLVEMKRKAEQGSMQLQGEVQELALEDILRSSFPHDEIREVGKGVKGADTIQVVRDHLGAECGRIVYESKRTKKFSEDWIEKLKADALPEHADVCVIVTQAMPEGMTRIGNLDGVWICEFHDVRGLAMVLREGLIRIHGALASQVNKGEKMQMLYDYMTGQEFRMQLEAIVEGFTSLRQGYEDEKLKMQKIWKEREKQLDRVLASTVGMYGSIRGIAGSAAPEIRMLED